MKVLIADQSAPVCEQILREAGHSVDIKTGLSPESLKQIIGEYQGLVVRSATRVTAEIISAADQLKVIGRAGSGVDTIDVDAARKRGVVVMNTPGGNSNAVAELVLAQMISLSRELHQAVASLKAHRWDKKKFAGGEIFQKTMGLLGYGRVSRLLGKKALALGMEVICFDPKIGKDLIDTDGIKLLSDVNEVCANADYLSMHLTRRTDTHNFLGRAEFAKAKRGAYFLNAARGGLVDEAALLWALEEGIVAGAALDVYENEPPVSFDLIDHPRVICTPHIGAATLEGQVNVARDIALQFVDYFAGKGARNSV